MIKRIKARWTRRRLVHDESAPGAGYHSRRLFAKARRRRRSLRMLVVLLVSLAGALLAVGYASSDTTGIGGYLSASSGRESSPSSPEEDPGGSAGIAPGPEQADTSPEAVAYRAVASEIPGMDAETVRGVYRSKLDPSWASVHVEGPEDEGTYVLFLQREGDSWTALRSIRADEPENPEYENVVLDGVPKDLVDSVYPRSLTTTESSGLLAEAVETGSLPSIEAVEPPTPETVTNEVPEDESERVEEGLEEARREIEKYASRYEGTAGVYVQDLNGRWGYGVNPDETFFGASVMKIPLMVAVFRKIDEGEFSLNDSFETESEDWAGGAGWLQWQEAGTSHTVEDYLWMTMTQSDNVATNALLRLVGGPEYVNEVTRSLGAVDTVLYQKVTSERAAVPALDNRTTPRDMATILAIVYAEEAASPESSRKMVGIMYQNDLQSSLKDG
ncbi:MAG: class A beta-lactamase-related serine hydrolase, partial [Actinomycetota bacterium]|nr:class A beta-lactamase-related serine hydrolase [Actinomycetota bacterium]